MSASALILGATLLMTVLHPLPVSRAQSAPSSTNTAAKSELRLGVPTWAGYGPLFLAQEQEYFDQARVGVVLVKGCLSGQFVSEIEDPTRRFALLADGKLDGLVTTLDRMALYWSPAFQFQAVLGLGDSNGGGRDHRQGLDQVDQ